MLIDPPFESSTRCSAAASLKEAIGRMRQTVAAIWYPVKDQRALRRFYQDLAGTGAPKLLRVELLVHPLDTPNSLNGSWRSPIRRGGWRKSCVSCCRGCREAWADPGWLADGLVDCRELIN
jgi:hypothetical protein